MYLPFTAVSRWQNAMACYTDLYVSGGDTYLRNEAWDDPRHEMGSPTMCFHAPLANNSTVDNGLGPSGTITGSPDMTDSPVISDGSLLKTQSCPDFDVGEFGVAPGAAGFYMNGVSTKFSFSLWYKLDSSTSGGPGFLFDLYRDNVVTFPGAHHGMTCHVGIRRPNGTFVRPFVKMQILNGSKNGGTSVTLEPDIAADNPFGNDFKHEEWNHLVFTHSGGNPAEQKLYLNGHMVDIDNEVFTFASQQFDPAPATYYPDVYINKNGSGGNGKDVALAFCNVYKDVLTQDDVHRHYQSMIRGLDLKLDTHYEDEPLRNRTDAQYTRTFTWDKSTPGADTRLVNLFDGHPTRPYAGQSEVARKTQAGASMMAGIQLKDDNDLATANYASRFFKHNSVVLNGKYTYTNLDGNLINSNNQAANPLYGWSFERFNRQMRLRWNNSENEIAQATHESAVNSIKKTYDTIGASVKQGATNGFGVLDSSEAFAAAGANIETVVRRPGEDEWRINQGEATTNKADAQEAFRILDQGQTDESGLTKHEQRIGPMSVFAQPLTESKYKSIRRLMLGQKPLRTRRPTRTVYRNHSLQASSRTIQ